MKEHRVPFVVAAVLAIFTQLPGAAAAAAAQQQEDLSQKIQPKAKVLPKQPSGPATGQVVQFRIGEFTVIVASPSASGGRSKAPDGCALKGEANFEGTPLFAFQGTVDPSGRSAVFDLVLLGEC